MKTLKERIQKGLQPKKSPEGFPDKSDKDFWRAWRLVTFFGVGTIWYAPGTLGSLAAIPVLVLSASVGQAVIGPKGAVAFIILTMLWLFFAGIRAANLCMEKIKEHDPTQIVVDEVVGMMLTLLLTFTGLVVPEIFVLGEIKELFGTHMPEIIVVCFFAFRVMDVVKPWPISWVDAHVKGGFGVMLDDILAALAAAVLSLLVYGMLIATVWKPY